MTDIQTFQEQLARLNGLIESAMDAIVSTDENQRIVLFNRAAEQMFGHRAADMMGQPLEALMPARFHDSHHRHVEAFGSTGITSRNMNVHGITRGLRASGEEFPIEASISKAEVSGRKIYTAILRDISVRRLAEKQISKSRALLEAVSELQAQFITESEHRATFDNALKILLDYSGSEYGFIGEVLHDQSGNPYLKAHTFTNIAWDPQMHALFDQQAAQGLEFRNLNTLLGAVMTTGKPVIANDPLHDPRAGRLPPGHPAMHCFLGLPLFKGTRLVGMLGIANRPGGYDPQLCDELTSLSTTCVCLIESWRSCEARRRAELALQQSDERLRQAVQIADIGFFDYDHLTKNLYWSPELRSIFGLEPDEAVTRNTKFEYVYPADRELLAASLRRAQEVDGLVSLSHRIVRRDGALRWLAVQFQTWFAGTGANRRMSRTIGAVRDITRRMQRDEALQLASSVYQASHEGILVTDENNLIIDVNPAFTAITGYTLSEVRGKNPRIFRSGMHDAAFYQQMWQAIEQDGYWQGEIWDKRCDGELHAKWLSISVIRHTDGSVFRYVAQFSDITDKKRQDDQIWTQANFDALTNLPNRRLLADRLGQAMASGVRSGLHGALLSLDLDHFKQLNDTFGHSMGDQLLIDVAQRLQASVREGDTVARMGGDEFLVVLKSLSEDANEAAIQAEQIAEKIRCELCRPYQLGDTEYHTSSSIGIVLFRGHSDPEEELLAHVDVAMYQAKAKGRNAICFFDNSMQLVLEKRSQLEAALRVALNRREFMLYYQLQVDHLGRPVGAEALLRWQHPQLGMVAPARFIPVAEETGMILPIGLWVLETACAQLARWQDQPQLRQLSIAVNVSARQFREAGFVAQVRDALNKTGIRAQVLKLELTESLVLDNVEDSICKMNELKELGVRFSMDDFGTGYSSLSYLSRLPVEQLKIDQSFVRDITNDPHDAAIVQTIISMALSLDMDVIAEGVETQAQREFLEHCGCRSYQGYLYARPVPIAELEQRLNEMQ